MNFLKVWYHQCKSRGVNCTNTELTNRGGCTIWLNEKQVKQYITIN